MNKHGIRLISFILALFSFLMVFQNIMNDQQQLPLGTTEQLVLNIADTRTTKEKLITGLDSIANKHNAILVKVAVPSEEYKDKKDIIYFGDTKPKSKAIIIDDDKIKWLDSKLEGNLISSRNIGNRPLYGNYAVKGSQNFKIDIENWANDNGIAIQWSSKVPFIKSLYYNLVHNGVGNVILIALLLFISAVLTWFISHSRARSIRLLGGVAAGKIHIEDTLTLSKLFIFSYVISLVTFWIYIGITNDFKQISLMLFKDIITLLVLILISALISISISVIAKPKMEHLAKREIPFKKFKILSVGIRIMSIILALLIIPSTVTSAYIAQKLSKEYSLWESMQSNVSLSFGDLDSLGTEKMLPYVDEFFSNMEVKNNLSLSLVIDKSIQLNEEEYGGYDHIIITDKSWIDSFDIGIRENKHGGKLNKVELNILDRPLQDFLNAQMPIWTKTEEVQPSGINFYEFNGDKFLALSPDGSTIQTKNPLVILVDNPVESLNTSGFTLPACSSGNIVFPDENLLRNEIAKNPIKEYVTSIDTIADVALAQAQKFVKEAIFYIIACILILTSMIFAGILTAQLWVSENNKRIFTLHTFGKSYKEIIMRAFVNESYIAIITIVIGAIISFVIKRTESLTILLVSIVILILYCLSNFIAYHICARQAFCKVATRSK